MIADSVSAKIEKVLPDMLLLMFQIFFMGMVGNRRPSVGV